MQKSVKLNHPNEQQLYQPQATSSNLKQPQATSSNLKQPHLKMDYAKAVKGKFKLSYLFY